MTTARTAVSAAPFVFPAGPDVKLLQLIHREHDGMISFHRRNPNNKGVLENLCSVPARALSNSFQQISCDIGEDAYFSINGMYRGARWPNRRGYYDERGQLLPGAHRNASAVRWLTSSFADLDCHKIGLDVHNVITKVIRKQEAGRLPIASVVILSGRGLWLFWMLTGVDYTPELTHARAWPERCQRWGEIQRMLGTELADVGADANARDQARISRIPGSLNGKSKTPVGYWVQSDSRGTMPAYTLDELAKRLGIVERKRMSTRKTAGPTTYRERGIKGSRGRWLKARAAIQGLWKLRGGFGPGTRNSAIWCYSIILKSLRIPDEQVKNEIYRLWRDFTQPLNDTYGEDEMLATMNAARPGNRKHIRNQTIADGLDITPGEAIVVGLPPASRFGKQTMRNTRIEIARHRQGLIQAEIDRSGNIPKAARLADVIEQAGLPRPSRKTICCDLKRCYRTQADRGGLSGGMESGRG